MLVESVCLLLEEKFCVDSDTKKAALKRLSFASYGAKAGLEHRNYPYDLKKLKFTTLDKIPSLIPSAPIGDNRTINVETLDQYS